MKHLTVLGAATLVFALLTGLGYHLDRSRIEQRRQALEQQISEELAGFERTYLRSALALLASGDASSEFLREVKAAQDALFADADWRSRAKAFDDLVGRIRPRVLAAIPAELGTGPNAQELRRLQDEMNGASHRRAVLLERVLDQDR